MTGEALQLRVQLAKLAVRHGRATSSVVLPLLEPVDHDVIVEGLAAPVSVDKEFMKFAPFCWMPFDKTAPLLYRHDPNRRVGEIQHIEATDKGLLVRALVTDRHARRCQGFSVGATIHSFRLYHQDDPDRFHGRVNCASVVEVSLTDRPCNAEAVVKYRHRPPSLQFYDTGIAAIRKCQQIVAALTQIAILSEPPVAKPPRLQLEPHRVGQFGQLVRQLEARHANP